MSQEYKYICDKCATCTTTEMFSLEGLVHDECLENPKGMWIKDTRKSIPPGTVISGQHETEPAATNDRIVQVSGFGVANTQATQSDFMIVGLTESGRVVITSGDRIWCDISSKHGSPASYSSALEKLDAAYIEAANAITNYREDAGFLPGAKVETDTKKRGTIAEYGNAWISVDHRSVPVILDTGKRQPWSIKSLKLIDEKNEGMDCINAGCGNTGAYPVEPDGDIEQCEWCHTEPNSKFNLRQNEGDQG